MKILTQSDQVVYREELAPKLPCRIFDAHVHVFDHDSLPVGFAFPARNPYNRFGGVFPLAMWRECMRELLPQQQVWVNCFGTPGNFADRSKTPPVNGETEFANVLVSPADSVEVLQQRIEQTGAVGVKPYLNYPAEFYGKSPDDVEVAEMLTAAQLDYLNKKGLAATIHIPRKARFADKLNQRQMIKLCEDYPHVKFIFAHVGRAYYMRNIQESNLSEFAQFPNAYFDTAMVNHTDVLKYAFDHFPAKRILFATDSPIALLHGKSLEINNQYAYLMGEDYAMGTAIYDNAHAVEFTTFFYEQLRAILAATPAEVLEDVLFNNARKLFQGIKP